MSSNLNILKWLFALVLIFGGFTSVVISVGFFHHWIIATEERKETEKMFHIVLGLTPRYSRTDQRTG